MSDKNQQQVPNEMNQVHPRVITFHDKVQRYLHARLDRTIDGQYTEFDLFLDDGQNASEKVSKFCLSELNLSTGSLYGMKPNLEQSALAQSKDQLYGIFLIQKSKSSVELLDKLKLIHMEFLREIAVSLNISLASYPSESHRPWRYCSVAEAHAQSTTGTTETTNKKDEIKQKFHSQVNQLLRNACAKINQFYFVNPNKLNFDHVTEVLNEIVKESMENFDVLVGGMFGEIGDKLCL